MDSNGNKEIFIKAVNENDVNVVISVVDSVDKDTVLWEACCKELQFIFMREKILSTVGPNTDKTILQEIIEPLQKMKAIIEILQKYSNN